MTWRRGFWRLTLLLWLSGLAGLAFVSGAFVSQHPKGEPAPDLLLASELCDWLPSLLRGPDGVTREGGHTKPCYVDDDLSAEEKAKLETARAEHHASQKTWESELRPAVLTRFWWKEPWAKRAAFWTAASWGSFYLLAWALAGFTQGRQ